MPFGSERQFAATLHQGDGRSMVFVKGALERLLPMCTQMATPQGDDPLHAGVVEQQALALAAGGYRVLAVAAGSLPFNPDGEFSEQHLQDLTLLGLVAMLDPLRPDAKAAAVACRHAGLSVAMVTGDHPLTVLAIARDLELAASPHDVVTGPELKQPEQRGDATLDALTAQARVFARVEPQQKLRIV
jgi:Ca2+-transporting ATPase